MQLKKSLLQDNVITKKIDYKIKLRNKIVNLFFAIFQEINFQEIKKIK
jgi:hypothetical protein